MKNKEKKTVPATIYATGERDETKPAPKRKPPGILKGVGQPRLKVTHAVATLLLLISAFLILPSAFAAAPGVIPQPGTQSSVFTNRLLTVLDGTTTTNRLYWTNGAVRPAFGVTNGIHIYSNATATARWQWLTAFGTVVATNTANRPTGTWNAVADGVTVYGSTRYEPRSPQTVAGSPSSAAIPGYVSVDADGVIVSPENFAAANGLTGGSPSGALTNADTRAVSFVGGVVSVGNGTDDPRIEFPPTSANPTRTNVIKRVGGDLIIDVDNDGIYEVEAHKSLIRFLNPQDAAGSLLAQTNSPTFYGTIPLLTSFGGSGSTINLQGNTGYFLNAYDSFFNFGSSGSYRFYGPDGVSKMELNSSVFTLKNLSSQNAQIGTLIMGDGQQPWGARVSTIIPLIGGDVSGAASHPAAGDDMWHQGILDPEAYATGWWTHNADGTGPGGTNYGATAITNQITSWLTNGMFYSLTNRGIRPTIMIDAAWMQKDRDANGRMMVNSNLYPSGMVAFKAWVNSQGYNLQGGIYYVNVPTNAYWVGILGNAASTASATDIKVAAVTPYTVHIDVIQAYTFFDSIRVADYIPADGVNQTTGHQVQSLNQFSYAIKYPGGYHYQQAGYSNRLGLSWFMGSAPYMPAAAALSANVLCSDHTVSDPIGTPVSLAVAGLRANDAYSSWGIGSGHFMSQFIVNWQQMSNVPGAIAAMATNSLTWDSFIASGALHSADFQGNLDTTIDGYRAFTNVNVFDVYFDKAYHPAWKSYDDGRFSVWVKPMTTGRYSVALYNESTTNRTYTFNYSDFNSPRSWRPIQFPPPFSNTNGFYKVTAVTYRTNIGYFESSFQVTVPTSNFLWVICKPVYAEKHYGYAVSKGGGASIANPDSPGGSGGPFYIHDGIQMTAAQSVLAFPVPNWTTNMTLLYQQYALATLSVWTNTIYAQYIGGVERFYNAGGVAPYDALTYGDNTHLSNITVTASWPVTNATKWAVIYYNAASNSNTRLIFSPIIKICE